MLDASGLHHAGDEPFHGGVVIAPVLHRVDHPTAVLGRAPVRKAWIRGSVSLRSLMSSPLGLPVGRPVAIVEQVVLDLEGDAGELAETPHALHVLLARPRRRRHRSRSRPRSGWRSSAG
jgi:hypothetical protein